MLNSGSDDIADGCFPGIRNFVLYCDYVGLSAGFVQYFSGFHQAQNNSFTLGLCRSVLLMAASALLKSSGIWSLKRGSTMDKIELGKKLIASFGV